MSEIAIDELIRLLPHDYPFMMIDRVLEYDDQSIIALKNVTYNEPHFMGHFPAYPVMPGVILIEAMAQAGGIVAMKALGGQPDDNVFLLASVEKARFKQMVRPGDSVLLHVEVLKKRSRLWKFKGQAKVDDQLVSDAEFSIVRA